MAITEESYNYKKEYWDYQRKLEYNRELLKGQIQSIKRSMALPNLQDMSDQNIFDMMWDRVDEEDLEEPTKHWIPKDKKYRLWNEDKTTRGRPVVLKAKKSENNNI